MPRVFVPCSQEDLARKILEAYEAVRQDLPMSIGNITPSGNVCKDVVDHAQIIPWRYLTRQMMHDLTEVDFDFENCSADIVFATLPLKVPLGFQTDEDFTFLGINAGGDWEVPVFFIIYWEGEQLRAYIPKDGNTWNQVSNVAIGNDEGQDIAELRRRFPTETSGLADEEVYDMIAVVNPDPDKLMQDIRANFEPRGCD